MLVKSIQERKNFLLHPHENQSKIFGQQGWVEVLMITLVSNKFLAMCIITLYSVYEIVRILPIQKK